MKIKVVSEVLRKYCVSVKKDNVSHTTTPRHNSTNLHTEISCVYIRPEAET